MKQIVEYPMKRLLLFCFFLTVILPGYVLAQAVQGIEFDKLSADSQITIIQGLAYRKMQIVDSLNNLATANFKSENPIVSPFVTGPEQDCSGAIPVCQQSYSQPNSYSGYGSVQEVYNTCLLVKERRSVWYIFTIQNSGTFGFTLNTTYDYDFALYDITSIGCSGVPNATPVRCNFAVTPGTTGLDIPTATTKLPALSNNAFGNKIMPGISNATAGETYALIIDNFTQDNTGYSITFNGTAQIFDTSPPTLMSASDNCTAGTITLTFSEPIKCSTINGSGNDFTVTGPSAITITGASGVNCTGNGLTSQATLTYTGATLSGTYTVTPSGTNTIVDKCGQSLSTIPSATFNHLGIISITPSASSFCSGGSATLTATNSVGATYSWTPTGSLSNSTIYNPVATPLTTTTYTVNVSQYGCTRTASQTLTVVVAPVTEVQPFNQTICDNTVNLTASATIDGVTCSNCNYSWNGGAYTQNNVASSLWSGQPAGTYTVQATSPEGCVGTSITTTITTPTVPPNPTCNILYVSPTGCATTGCGETKSNPATLQYALVLAECNNVIIKMQVGTYTLTDFVTVKSFVTIEGGYNAGFTSKTSDLSSGAATRIVRSAASSDSDNSLRFTAFKVAASSKNFRFQDMRIEMPTTHAYNSSKSNYGINIGGGCSNYDIVRCYIDAGNGANGP